MNQWALDTAEELIPGVWSIKDLLTPDEINNLLTSINDQTEWQDVDLQVGSARKQIPWQPDGIVDWLWSKFNALDFSRFAVRFRTVMIWRDTAGYTINTHTDNNRVHAAMQIYISASHQNLGTWFDPDIEIPFVQNTGYFMHNRDRPAHGMRNSVPVGYDRVSCYALFDDIEHARGLHR